MFLPNYINLKTSKADKFIEKYYIDHLLILFKRLKVNYTITA